MGILVQRVMTYTQHYQRIRQIIEVRNLVQCEGYLHSVPPSVHRTRSNFSSRRLKTFKVLVQNWVTKHHHTSVKAWASAQIDPPCLRVTHSPPPHKNTTEQMTERNNCIHVNSTTLILIGRMRGALSPIGGEHCRRALCRGAGRPLSRPGSAPTLRSRSRPRYRWSSCRQEPPLYRHIREDGCEEMPG